jgi:hypothetical protein
MRIDAVRNRECAIARTRSKPHGLLTLFVGNRPDRVVGVQPLLFKIEPPRILVLRRRALFVLRELPVKAER